MLTTQAKEGSLRLRHAHAFVESDSRCAIVYDLERTFVIDVPLEFQSSVVSAISGDTYNPALGRWLEEEGLLTRESWRSLCDPKDVGLPLVTDVSLDISGSCNMSCVYCFEEAIHSRIGKMSDEMINNSLDFAFRQAEGSRHLALHFGSGEPLLRFEQLARLIEEANSRAQRQNIVVSYELTTNATLVTHEIAEFLAAHPINVRVSCDGPSALHDVFRPMSNGESSYDLVTKGLALLHEFLGERVTVNSVICGRTRLKDIWLWAKSTGIRHFHVIKVGANDSSNVNLQRFEQASFRDDLVAISDDILSDLEAGNKPIDFQPLTKVIRRLMIPQPITRFCGVAGTYLGVAANGEVYPCFRHLGLEEYKFGEVGGEIDERKRVEFLKHEAADVDNRAICENCWARYLCGGGCYADSVVYGPEKNRPQESHCTFWQVEIEAAVRLFVRLREADPRYCLKLFGADEGNEFSFLNRVNCS